MISFCSRFYKEGFAILRSYLRTHSWPVAARGSGTKSPSSASSPNCLDCVVFFSSSFRLSTSYPAPTYHLTNSALGDYIRVQGGVRVRGGTHGAYRNSQVGAVLCQVKPHKMKD